MTIPKEQYLKEAGITFVTKELLERYHTKSEVDTFGRWFCGQTGMMTSSGSMGIYAWDYERWVSQGTLEEQLPHDWD